MTRQDLLPEGATAPIGGPLGRHASERSSSWRHLVARLVALVALPIGLSVVQKGHCISNGWSGDEQFWRACFSDLPAQYQLHALGGGLTAYLDGSADPDRPLLTGAVMSFVGGLVPDASVLDQTRWYFLLWTVLITVLLMVTVWCTAATRPDRLTAAAQVALSPVVFLTALIAADALAVALVAGALLAWQRRWLLPAGVLLGLGVLAQTYVLVVGAALVLTAWRWGRLEQARLVLAYAATVAFTFLAALAVTNPEATFAAYRAWWDAPASYGSPWLIPQLFGSALPDGLVTALAVAGWVGALTLGWLFAKGAWRPPTWAQVAFVAVAVIAVTGKAFPVQASLWLVPLAALAGVRWRDHLVWAAAEGLHFVAVWLYIGGQTVPDRGLPAEWYAVALLVRIAAVVWLVTRVWSQPIAASTPDPHSRSAGPTLGPLSRFDLDFGPAERPVDDDSASVGPNRYP